MAIIQDIYQLETAQFQEQIRKVQAGYEGTAKGADKAATEGKKFGSETAKGAKEADGALKELKKEAGGVEEAFKKLGKQVAAAFAVAKIKQFVTASIQEFASFEARLSNVATLVDTNVESIDAMGKKLLEIAGRVPVAVDDLAASLYDVRSAGISSAQAMDVLEQSARLGVAGLASTADATNLMTSAMNAFAAEGLTADQIADILFKTVKAGKTDIGQLAQAFGATAPAIEAAGVSLADFQAATAALTTVGTPASQAQAQLRAAMVELQKPGKELQIIFEQLGVSSGRQLIETAGGMGEAFKMISEQAALSGKTVTQVTSSVEAAAAITALGGAVNESYVATLADMVGGLGALDEAFEKQNETVASAMQRISNMATQSMVLIGEQLAPAIRSVADAFTWVNQSGVIQAFFNTIKEILEPVVQVFRDMGDSFARVFRAFNKEGADSQSVIQGLTKLMKLLAIPMQLVWKAIGLVIEGWANMVIAVKEFIDMARAVIKPLDNMINGLGRLANFLGNKLFPTVGQGVDQLGKLRTALEGLTDAEKIARLQKWREALKDNEAAVKIIDAEIAKLTTTTEKFGETAPKQTEAAKRGFELLREEISRLKSVLEDEAFANLITPETVKQLKDAENQMRRIALRMEEAVNGAKELGEVDILPDGLPDLSDILGELPQIAAESVEEMDRAITDALENLFDWNQEQIRIQSEQAQLAFEQLQESLAAFQAGASGFSAAFSDIINAIGNESGDLAAFTKALAVFDVAMKQGQAIAAAIAGATAAAASTGPGAPFVLAGYIASMVGAVVAGFAQVGSILATEPPRFFEGTPSVPLAGNPKGRDTIPAYLNEGEAVIPTDKNRAYPGLAEAWIGGDLDRYIHKNWIAPTVKAAERERAERELNAIGQMLVQGFDDYRLHKDNREMIGVMRSGFDRLSKNRLKGYQWGSK